MKRPIYFTWCGILIACFYAAGPSVGGRLYGQDGRQNIEAQVVLRRQTGETTLQRVSADRPTTDAESGSECGASGIASIHDSQAPSVISVSCTVYDRQISWIRWSVEGRKYSGFVNGDLGLLGHVQSFAHNDIAYKLHMAVGYDTRIALQERNARMGGARGGGVRELPNVSSLPDGGLQLILENADVADEQVKKDCRAIRDMLAYLEANCARLGEEQAAMHAEQSQESDKVAASAKTTKNSVTKFWKIAPKKSVEARDSKN